MPKLTELATKHDALAHPIRLNIIVTLAQAQLELYLNEIAYKIGVSRALAKIHLKKLEKAGIVKSHIVTAEGEAKALRYYELLPFDIHVSPQMLRMEVEKNGQ
jgi:predicted transcriptional regulator